jgi:hypothetical protein
VFRFVVKHCGLGRGLQALEVNSRVSPLGFPHSLLLNPKGYQLVAY